MFWDAPLEALHGRWQRAGFLDYPLWIPLVMDGSALLAAGAAVAQRAGTQPLGPSVLLVILAVAPWLACLTGAKPPWWSFATPVVAGSVGAMALYPVEFDFAVFLLVLMAGHLGATDTLAGSAAATMLAGAVLVGTEMAGEFGGSKFWFAALVVGWDVGFMLQYQQRRLEEQAATQSAREAEAALEERQRIAREVHDVVAHSLSVTMLHLTAARRDLEDDDPASVAEALDGLREAERVGRQAMTDIRRTVGLLASGDGEPGTSPTPGLWDVPALVEEFRAAGMTVDMLQDGAADQVPAAVALALYRVLQESLSNVAKHAPGAPARVRLAVGTDVVRLEVENQVGGLAPAGGFGSGIRGMVQRVQLLDGWLQAGGAGGTWRVLAELPVEVPERRAVETA